MVVHAYCKTGSSKKIHRNVRNSIAGSHNGLRAAVVIIFDPSNTSRVCGRQVPSLEARRCHFVVASKIFSRQYKIRHPCVLCYTTEILRSFSPGLHLYDSFFLCLFCCESIFQVDALSDEFNRFLVFFWCRVPRLESSSELKPTADTVNYLILHQQQLVVVLWIVYDLFKSSASLENFHSGRQWIE